MKKFLTFIFLVSLLFANSSFLFCQSASDLMLYKFTQNNSSKIEFNPGTLEIENYLLRPYDTLKLSLYGLSNIDYELLIDINGDIYIPELGKISVKGKKLKEVYKILDDLLKKKSNFYNYSLFLIKPVEFSVIIDGYVAAPGIYNANGFTNILEMISRAGGILPNGSNNILIYRSNKEIKINLREYISGIKNLDDENFYLYQGDRIYVPVIKDYVIIEGHILFNPRYSDIQKELLKKENVSLKTTPFENSLDIGKIEITEAENINYILEKANLKNFANFDYLEISDINNNIRKKIQNNELSKIGNIEKIYPGEKITIYTLNNYVIVTGEVTKGDIFSYQPGKNISYYIGLSNGITETGNINKIKVISKDGKISYQNLQYIPQKEDIIIVKQNSVGFVKNYIVPISTIGTFLVNIFILMK